MKINLKTYEKHSKYSSKACVIWMHGLGSNADNMLSIAAAFPDELAVSHILVDAPVRPITINNNMPMQAWYNIAGVKLTDREDKQGIIESANSIKDIIDEQIKKGFKSSQIFLAGFSQGGAMSLFTGLSTELQLGGIISLSAYLPLVSEIKNVANHNTPVFISLGLYDQIVLPEWSKASYNWLIDNKFTNVSIHEYPMEHNICIEEIRDLCGWLNIQISNQHIVEKI